MGKRDYGESSISERKDGTWTARIYLGRTEDGKQKIKALYGKTEQEVKKKLKAFKNNTENLIKTNIKKVTLEEYINNWLYTYRKNELKPSSFDRLESTIKHHINPNLGFIQLQNVTSDDIQKLINDLYENNLSHSTIKKVYDALNACFKFALVKDDIIKNPVLGASMPSINNFEKKEIIFFSKEEREKFKAEALRKYKTGRQVYGYGQAFILMLNTGIRESEMCGIQKQDIDLEHNTLHIKRNVVVAKERDKIDISQIKGYKKRLQDSTKTYSGDRIIPLNKSAKLAIQSLLNQSKHPTLLASTQDGQLIAPDYLSKTFNKILIGARLSQCGTHTLRHTFASVLFEKGIDVKVVSELLGHSDVTITYNTYIHLIKKQKAKAIETLDDL